MIKLIKLKFKKLIISRRLKNIRQMIRGYQTLKKNGKINLISKIKEELTNTKLKIDSRHFNDIFFGISVEKAEIITRQYLLARFADINLNKQLLIASQNTNKKYIFILPPEWLGILIKHDVNVSLTKSKIMWNVCTCAFYFYGIVEIIKIIFKNLSELCAKKNNILRDSYVYFADLNTSNTPTIKYSKERRDIISWYLQWSGKQKYIKYIYHNSNLSENLKIKNINIKYLSAFIPALNNKKMIFNFIYWSIFAIFIAGKDFIFGKWWHALMLKQFATAAQIKFNPNAFLAKEYLFSQSSWIYRPIWTYEAESRGSKISLYFYATNIENFQEFEKNKPFIYGYRAMNWPNYLVWDEYQKCFIQKATGCDSCEIVGPIWHSCKGEFNPIINSRTISVFDVIPYRSSIYCTLGANEEFYVPATVNLFLNDIQRAIEMHHGIMLWKKKREINKSEHPYYSSNIKLLLKNTNIVSVNPDISPFKIIRYSSAVISLPFTSTAIIAKSMHKKTAYYDPTMRVLSNDPAAHGIEVIRGFNELLNWLTVNIDQT